MGKSSELKIVFIILIIAFLVKLSLFIFIINKAPQAIMQNDSHQYLSLAKNLAKYNIFGQVNKRGQAADYETLRTPGYPAFLAFLHGKIGLNLSAIIFVQIIITLLSAAIVYKTATLFDKNLATLSLLIMVFDPTITVFSLFILTETLFLFVLTLFMFCIVKYLKIISLPSLIASSILLSLSVYIRPISFYLVMIFPVFILIAKQKNSIKLALIHSLIFLLLGLSILSLWMYRNYKVSDRFAFSDIRNITVDMKGIINSYTANEDPISRNLPPLFYYANVSSRCFLSLMTRPESLKYFGSKPLRIIGKVISYPWITFWLIGFVFGIYKFKIDKYFLFIITIFIYFVMATIIGAMWGSGPRFRIPLMPSIAILSSYGWLKIKEMLYSKGINA